MRLKQAWLLCSCKRRPSHHPPVGRTNILVMLMEGGEYLYILQSAEENRGEGERLWMECGYLWGCCWRMIYDSPHMGKREWIRIVLRYSRNVTTLLQSRCTRLCQWSRLTFSPYILWGRYF
jgi:hypothetical protein